MDGGEDAFMDLDISIEGADSSNAGSSSQPDPVCRRSLQPHLQTLTVHHGRITCQICFISSERKHIKRKNFQRLTDIVQFKKFAEFWEKVDHEFNNINKLVNWEETKDKWAHKACKGKFFKKEFLQSQPNLTSQSDPPAADNQRDDPREIFEPVDVRRSSRKQHTYESSWKETEQKRCIICNKDIRVKGRIIPPTTISLVGKAEPTLKEFAEIHIKNNNQKYIEGAKRILLTLSTKSLLAADVAYHREECYIPFRSPAWKREKQTLTFSRTKKEDNAWLDLCQLLRYHILVQKEVYSLAQVRNLYDESRRDLGEEVSKTRSVDLKKLLEKEFGNGLAFVRSEKEALKSEYVLSGDTNMSYDVIKSCVSGQGIPRSVAIKSTAQMVHKSLRETQAPTPWPPTPQDIMTGNYDVNTDLYNLISWIVEPRGQIGDNGRVKLPKSKAQKVCQITQNIETLLPNAAPSLDQVLLSLTMHRKTGSMSVINTLHRLGHGISYSETMFVEDKWAEWSQNQSSLIPSNIHQGIPTTLVADNIDWKNKSVRGSTDETHNTNCILVQHKSCGQNEEIKSPVSLQPSYDYDRKAHRSFKGLEVNLPDNTAWKKSEPPKLNYSPEVTGKREMTSSSKKTLVWAVSRNHSKGEKETVIPAWTGFQVKILRDEPKVVNIGFMPAIPAPPTQRNVIEEIMNRAMGCMHELQLDHIFLEVDQAIYNKVLQVLFDYREKGSNIYDNLIVRMGGFHVIICLLRTIYSRFHDSGIVELLVEAGVGSEGSLRSAMKASDVKFGIRCYKILFEALLRTKIEFIMETLALNQDISWFNDLCSNGMLTPDAIELILQDPRVKLLPKLEGDMAEWLDSFLNMVNLLLNIIFFQRTGNWQGYLEAIHEFLPWCFALNRQNYARNLSFFYVDMLNLRQRAPEAHGYFCNGGFSGSLTGKKFTMIPMDQMIEMTINRSSKEFGGLSGVTENKGASERWMRINHILAALKQHLEDRIQRGQLSKHAEFGNLRMKKDEEDVSRVVAGLKTWLPNMWSKDQPLVNISDGTVASNEMVRNVLSARRAGEEALSEFLMRFTSVANAGHIEEARPKYNDPIKKQKVYTYTKDNKKTKKQVTIPEDESQSLANILVQFDEKRLDLKYLLQWPVTSKPWAICSAKEKSRSSSKSLFRNNLQLLSPIPCTTTAPNDISCCIVDAMRVVRMIPISNLTTTTYLAWAKRLAQYIKQLPGNTVHIVFDVYTEQGSETSLSKGRVTKSRERKIEDLSQKLPKVSEWADFLTNSKNKSQLALLLADFFLGESGNLGKDVYVTKGSQCFYSAVNAPSLSTDVPELKSNQREADPRVAFHAVFVSTTDPVCVVADDTDIYILLLYVSEYCHEKVYFRQGTGTSKEGITYHDVKSLAHLLGESVCKNLPAFHALTGCDYTSPFFGRSKFGIFKCMQKNPNTVGLLSSLRWERAAISDVIDFILHVVYNRSRSETTAAQSRYATAIKTQKNGKKTFADTRRIPPDESSLKMKIMRTNYVTLEFVNCLNNSYVSKNPREYGWEEVDGKFMPIWFEGDPLPSVEEVETLDKNTEETRLDDVGGDEQSDDSSSDEVDYDVVHTDSEYSEDDDD